MSKRNDVIVYLYECPEVGLRAFPLARDKDWVKEATPPDPTRFAPSINWIFSEFVRERSFLNRQYDGVLILVRKDVMFSRDLCESCIASGFIEVTIDSHEGLPDLHKHLENVGFQRISWDVGYYKSVQR